MRIAEATVFFVTMHTATRKGRLYLVERYNGHYYKTRTVAGPLRKRELAAAIAERQEHWDSIRKALTLKAVEGLIGVAK